MPQLADRPTCFWCDEPALDGHLTCGSVSCPESAAREAQARLERALQGEQVGAYLPPDQHPTCLCKGNPMAAFFCPTGHMTECHHPMSCDVARCSHLARYR